MFVSLVQSMAIIKNITTKGNKLLREKEGIGGEDSEELELEESELEVEEDKSELEVVEDNWEESDNIIE